MSENIVDKEYMAEIITEIETSEGVYRVLYVEDDEGNFFSVQLKNDDDWVTLGEDKSEMRYTILVAVLEELWITQKRKHLD